MPVRPSTIPAAISPTIPAAISPTIPATVSTLILNGIPAQPFPSAEAAWFWTMAALRARHDGARYTANQGSVRRPCEPDDVVRCLDALWRRRRIDLVHARVLRVWGERQVAPCPKVATERCDFRLWHEALERLEWPLRVKGIVV